MRANGNTFSHAHPPMVNSDTNRPPPRAITKQDPFTSEPAKRHQQQKQQPPQQQHPQQQQQQQQLPFKQLQQHLQQQLQRGTAPPPPSFQQPNGSKSENALNGRNEGMGLLPQQQPRKTSQQLEKTPFNDLMNGIGHQATGEPYHRTVVWNQLE